MTTTPDPISILRDAYRAAGRDDLAYRIDETSNEHLGALLETPTEQIALGEDFEDGESIGYSWSTYAREPGGEWDLITTDSGPDEASARDAVARWVAALGRSLPTIAAEATRAWRYAAEDAETARLARDAAIRDAMTAGVPVAMLAEDTGLSRERLYQIRDRRR